MGDSDKLRAERYKAALLRIASASHPLSTGGHDRLRYYRMACEGLGEPFDYSCDALWRLQAQWNPEAEKYHEGHKGDWRLAEGALRGIGSGEPAELVIRRLRDAQ